MDQDKKPGLLARLNPRERNLLVLWAVSMIALVLFLGSWLAWSSISEKVDAAAAYQDTLDLLSRRQAEFLASQNKDNGGSLDERVANNELKLQSFLDREAARHTLKISNFKESNAPLGGKKGDPKAILEESITIDVEDAPFPDLSRFLDSIARSKELIVVKRVHVERSRKFQTDGTFKMTMIVSTFKKENP